MKLKEFLKRAKITTYASDGKLSVLEDGSKELIYEEKEFKYRDMYFGFNPFIGEEIVFKNNKAIWGMNYYGFISSNVVSAKQVYEFLKKALRKVTDNQPYRGPGKLKEGEFEYTNNVRGSVDNFTGTEIIYYKGKEVYILNYYGGIIKQK